MKVLVRFGLWLVSSAILMPAAALAQSAQAPASTAAASPPASSSSAASEAVPFPPCRREPSSSDLSAAKGAFQAGWVSYDEGDYGRAITYWEDAFRRDCTAVKLLLNLARAYELAGTPERAVNALETYLERVPDSSERGGIERRIEVMREKIAEAQRSKPTVVEPDAAEKKAADSEPSQDQRVQSTPKAQPERSLVPLIVSGLGVAAFITGGAFYLDSTGEVDDYAKQCNVGGSRQCPEDSITDAANSARTRAKVTTVVSLAGAATAIGGLVWYFLGEPRRTQVDAARSRSRVALYADATPGFAGLVLLGDY